MLGCKPPPPTTPAAIASEPNRLYWGDTHVHSSFSADAYALGNHSADPDTAYRWAKGLPVVNPFTQAKVQIERPLDFMVLADHAEGLGGPLGLEQAAAWGGIVEAAERHYAPCSFTSFIGWEWTSTPDGKSLHRVVFMKDGREQASQFTPFSALDSSRPEDLWGWLEGTSTRVGTDFLAIPHNSNLSRGAMFADVDSEGRPITAAYARTRMRWEPVAEVTQFKGDSETHPSLSPDDEFADFERFSETPRGSTEKVKVREGDYARSGLLRGLGIDQAVGANPFKFGLIGSTDSHTGLASAEEDNFWGATTSESDPGNEPVPGPEGRPGSDMSAQGLTAVWAEENTRASIFAAFKRKEVYATTGPRIRVRFFGGWGFAKSQAGDPRMVTVGYTLGYPMGSNLTKGPEGKAPGFLMYAVKDPDGANLDRIQIVKGWVDADGKTHEKVFDVAWSDKRERSPDGKVPPVVNSVDLSTAKYLNASGAPALRGFWSDPEFDPEQRSFYYMRVLQIPTPRHTLYDAVARKADPSQTGHPPTIQERAYTSPIWYTP
jgi:hypothetical protein